MHCIRKIKHYSHKNNIDIAFIFVMIGIIMTPIITKAWILALIACPFIKDENDKHLFI